MLICQKATCPNSLEAVDVHCPRMWMSVEVVLSGAVIEIKLSWIFSVNDSALPCNERIGLAG